MMHLCLMFHCKQVVNKTMRESRRPSTEAECRAIASTLGPANLFPSSAISMNTVLSSRHNQGGGGGGLVKGFGRGIGGAFMKPFSGKAGTLHPVKVPRQVFPRYLGLKARSFVDHFTSTYPGASRCPISAICKH